MSDAQVRTISVKLSLQNNLLFFKSKWEECAVFPFYHLPNFVINLWIAMTLDLLIYT